MRDYSATETVKVGDRAYEVGWMPRGIWRRLCLQAAEDVRRATRKALLRLREQGVTSPAQAEVDGERFLDPDYLDAIDANQVEAVRWSLRGITQGGHPVVLPRETAEYQGRKFEVVALGFVQDLAEDTETISLLYSAVAARNSVQEDARKNSPPPSPTARGDGDATSA